MSSNCKSSLLLIPTRTGNGHCYSTTTTTEAVRFSQVFNAVGNFYVLRGKCLSNVTVCFATKAYCHDKRVHCNAAHQCGTQDALLDTKTVYSNAKHVRYGCSCYVYE